MKRKPVIGAHKNVAGGFLRNPKGRPSGRPGVGMKALTRLGKSVETSFERFEPPATTEGPKP
jgi:hypothetical protein